ncbi:hypothetical protein FGO68_gene15143 [Halteria grandinella]|uniref:Uncharacterized protein n=1 Tax=Halteria grandinella TaxID=5974 RepID=A0A8J8NIM5_HALGN|nr:hypothetical protein FGO68_gene15143 [Halteria grandinella]
MLYSLDIVIEAKHQGRRPHWLNFNQTLHLVDNQLTTLSLGAQLVQISRLYQISTSKQIIEERYSFKFLTKNASVLLKMHDFL